MNQLSNGLVEADLINAVAMTELTINEEGWIMLKSKRSLLFVVVLIVASFLLSVPVEAGPSNVRLTWMGVTSWLIEVADLRIIMDGYITRNPTQALGPDEEAIQQVMDALGGNGKVDYILSGHGHFDHAFDTAVWARETGAQIIGSRTTCFEAIAQGIPDSQCTTVEGGDRASRALEPLG
jgi:glyoxylase-like metal-dependent hydrolase (beta-lactamase superfamily II)